MYQLHAAAQEHTSCGAALPGGDDVSPTDPARPDSAGHSAETLTEALADGDPTIVTRAHHADEGYIYLDAIEMTDDEIALVCRRVREILSATS